MKAWHWRMTNLYNYLEIFQNGTKQQRRDNTKEAIKVNAELELLSDEIMRRECDPLDPDEINDFINLDLN